MTTEEFRAGMEVLVLLLEDETCSGTYAVEPRGVMTGPEPIPVVAICDDTAMTLPEVVVVVILPEVVIVVALV